MRYAIYLEEEDNKYAKYSKKELSNTIIYIDFFSCDWISHTIL